MKVPHIDREVSFGNRHSKISEPKDFLQKISNHRTLAIVDMVYIISILYSIYHASPKANLKWFPISSIMKPGLNHFRNAHNCSQSFAW